MLAESRSPILSRSCCWYSAIRAVSFPPGLVLVGVGVEAQQGHDDGHAEGEEDDIVERLVTAGHAGQPGIEACAFGSLDLADEAADMIHDLEGKEPLDPGAVKRLYRVPVIFGKAGVHDIVFLIDQSSERGEIGVFFMIARRFGDQVGVDRVDGMPAFLIGEKEPGVIHQQVAAEAGFGVFDMGGERFGLDDDLVGVVDQLGFLQELGVGIER